VEISDVSVCISFLSSAVIRADRFSVFFWLWWRRAMLEDISCKNVARFSLWLVQEHTSDYG